MQCMVERSSTYKAFSSQFSSLPAGGGHLLAVSLNEVPHHFRWIESFFKSWSLSVWVLSVCIVHAEDVPHRSFFQIFALVCDSSPNPPDFHSVLTVVVFQQLVNAVTLQAFNKVLIGHFKQVHWNFFSGKNSSNNLYAMYVLVVLAYEQAISQ